MEASPACPVDLLASLTHLVRGAPNTTPLFSYPLAHSGPRRGYRSLCTGGGGGGPVDSCRPSSCGSGWPARGIRFIRSVGEPAPGLTSRELPFLTYSSWGVGGATRFSSTCLRQQRGTGLPLSCRPALPRPP